jgi:hypothetical protein
VIPYKSAGIDIKICHGLLQRGIKVQPQDGGKTPWHKLDATTDANKKPGNGVSKGSVSHFSMTRPGHNLI